MSDWTDKLKIKFEATYSTGFRDEPEMVIRVVDMDPSKKMTLSNLQALEETFHEHTFTQDDVENVTLTDLKDDFIYEGEADVVMDHWSSVSYEGEHDYDCNICLTVTSWKKSRPLNDDFYDGPPSSEKRKIKVLTEENETESLILRVLSKERLFLNIRYDYVGSRKIVPAKEFIQAVAWFLNSTDEERKNMLIKSRLKIG